MAKAHLPRRKGMGVSPATFIQRSRSVSAEEKAQYHNEDGAGKRHVIREFFGLNPDDEAVIVAAIEAGIERQLEKDSQ